MINRIIFRQWLPKTPLRASKTLLDGSGRLKAPWNRTGPEPDRNRTGPEPDGNRNRTGTGPDRTVQSTVQSTVHSTYCIIVLYQI